MKTLAQPIKPQLMIRILILIIVVLSYFAGFYHSAWKVEQEKYKYLETQYNKLVLN